MAYNFTVKEFSNGTLQLTYYDNPILDGYDKSAIAFKKNFNEFGDYDLEFDYDYDCYCPWGDSEGYIRDLTDKELDKARNKIKSYTDEELAKKHEHCVKSSLTRSIHKIYDLARNNVWEWFFTFTLNENAVLDKYDYEECSKKVCKWFNNIRRLCPSIKYLIVPEKHYSGAWHYHALVSNCDELEFVVAKNNQEFKKDEFGNVKLNKKGQPIRNKHFGDDLRVSYPDGNYIYNIANYNIDRYGFSTATKIIDTKKATSYIVKYLTKELSECTFGKRRYFQSNNLLLPEVHHFIENKSSLSEVIKFVEDSFGVKVVPEYIKTIKVTQANYSNTISYLEFADACPIGVGS